MPRKGQVDEEAVTRVLAHPFFARSRRNRSTATTSANGWRRKQALRTKASPDGAATLTAITAASVAPSFRCCRSRRAAGSSPAAGRSNLTLMRMLAQRLAPASVETANAVGWNSDAVEAQAFAYMAVRHLRGLPITFPTTTGVPEPMQGGVLAQP